MRLKALRRNPSMFSAGRAPRMASALPLLLAAALAAISCARKTQPKESLGEEKEKRIGVALAYESGRLDKLRNASVWAGLCAQAQASNARLFDGQAYYQAKGLHLITCLRPRASGRDLEQIVRTLANGQAGMIVMVGSGYRAVAQGLAPLYPEQNFIILDASAETDAESGKETERPGNLSYLGFSVGDAAYLAGRILAPDASTSGLAPAFLGRSEDPESQSCLAAWARGYGSGMAAAGDQPTLTQRWLKAVDKGPEPKRASAGDSGGKPASAIAELLSHKPAAILVSIGEVDPESQKLLNAADCPYLDFSGAWDGTVVDGVFASLNKRHDRIIARVCADYLGGVNAPRGDQAWGYKEGCVDLAAGAKGLAVFAARSKELEEARKYLTADRRD